MDRNTQLEREIQAAAQAYMENRFEHLICNILIVFGILFIYNRLRGNLPNVIILIKEFSTY